MPSTLPFVRIGVLVGSLRRGSFNRIVANTLPSLAPARAHLVKLPELHDVPPFDQDLCDHSLPMPVQSLADAIHRCDAVVIVSPEYNFSMPGVLKNGLDWLSRVPGKPLSGKPVALQSATTAALGGVRGQHHLRQVMVALNAHVRNLPEVIIGNVDRKVDPTLGRLTDATALDLAARQLSALVTDVLQLQPVRAA